MRTEKASLMHKVDRLEADVERERKGKEKIERELAAVKELCTKLDVEKEKLRAEVNEYAAIRRELEREIKKLHNDPLMNRSSDSNHTDSLQQEIARLKNDLADERRRGARYEQLAKDYHLLRKAPSDDEAQPSTKQLSHSADRFSSF